MRGAELGPGSEIVGVACRDVTNEKSAVVAPFVVEYRRADTNALIGTATCAARDAQVVWSAAVSAAIPSGTPILTSVTNSPNPTGTTLVYCFATQAD